LEEELLAILSRGVLYKDSKDFITWSGDPKGIFSVKSTYGLLASQGTGPCNAFWFVMEDQSDTKSSNHGLENPAGQNPN